MKYLCVFSFGKILDITKKSSLGLYVSRKHGNCNRFQNLCALLHMLLPLD